MIADRTAELVRTFLGPTLCALLEQPDVMDVIVRPTWAAVDRAGEGLSPVPRALSEVRPVELLRLLGPLVGKEILADNEVVELQLPGFRARFAGVFLGLRGADSFFTIRRATARGLTLHDYLDRGTFDTQAHARLREIVDDPLHGLLIAGATGSGKTTFLATMLGEIIRAHGHAEHLVIVEDTLELLVDGPMVTSIVSSTHFSYRAALRASLRHRPTRLVVGEVRGGEALDAVKAGATGHGLMMTIHASTAEGAVRTLLARMAEGADGRIDERLVPEAIRTVAVFRRMHDGIRLTELGTIRAVTPEITIERIIP